MPSPNSEPWRELVRAACRRKPPAKLGAWSPLPLLVHDAIALLPPGRTAQLPHEGMTLKLGSRGPVLVDSVDVPAASANVPDEHVDVVEDDPAPAAVGDDAIPHVCDASPLVGCKIRLS